MFLHEIGHMMSLGDQYGTSPNTVMNQGAGTNDVGGTQPTKIQGCDNTMVQNSTVILPPPQPPQPEPNPPLPPLCELGGPPNSCANNVCIPPPCDPGTWWEPCDCRYWGSNPSPIVIDTDGSGFHLTSAADGVQFDFFGTGEPIQISWIAKGSTNGWLALDRNGNGVIDNAKELFGNFTDQPPVNDRNGFLALAVFDQPAYGGNGDGVIDYRDAIWPKLLVWIDANHDGISQPEELHHITDLGIHSIDLAYHKSQFTDAYGNQFRYKGRLNPVNPDAVNRVIYDVFLTTGTTAELTTEDVLNNALKKRRRLLVDTLSK